MTRVLKGNCEYKIPENYINDYLQKGFAVIDDSGKVVQASKPTTLLQYKAYSAQLEAENANLKAEVEKLKATAKANAKAAATK